MPNLKLNSNQIRYISNGRIKEKSRQIYLIYSSSTIINFIQVEKDTVATPRIGISINS